MNMLEYARREVELAKEIEKQDLEEGEFDYGGACYDSALKAFESLTQDGHSGFSIGLTKNILNRLIDGKPLIPIEDTDDVWNLITDNEGQTQYQCSRMSSLFKYVEADGTIKYRDINISYCIDIHTRLTYNLSLVQNTIDDMYPITMPYMPSDKPIQVYCEDLLTDPRNGDFDTVGILYLVTPDGTKIILNRYFKEDGEGWTEIDVKEYGSRVHKAELLNQKISKGMVGDSK